MAGNFPSSNNIEYIHEDEAETNEASVVHTVIDEENEVQSLSMDHEEEEDRGVGSGGGWRSVELSIRTSSPPLHPSFSSQDAVVAEGGGEASLLQGETADGEPRESEFDACPICMDTFNIVGDHRICCLPCGHLYGLSCIMRWLMKHKRKCPQCKKRCTLGDVRKIYGHAVGVDQELVKKAQSLEAKCTYLEKKDQVRKRKEIRWMRREDELTMQLHNLKEEVDDRNALLEKRIEILEAHEVWELQSDARLSKMQNQISNLRKVLIEKFPEMASVVTASSSSNQGESNVNEEQEG